MSYAPRSILAVFRQPSDDTSSGSGSSGSDSGGDLFSDVGNEISVAPDRWSVHSGVSDLIAAGIVVALGFCSRGWRSGWSIGPLATSPTRP